MRKARVIRPARYSGHRLSESRWSLAPSEPSDRTRLPDHPASPAEDREREIQSLREDLAEAAQVQHRLNGPRELRRGNYEIACETFPVGQISGDFCSVFDVGTRTVIALGDIAGKGLKAGMWFTHVVSLVRIHAGSTSDPADAMAAVNGNLCSLRSDPPLITVLLGSLDWSSNTLSYCRAGHPPPILVRARGGSELLHEGGPVLGVVTNAHFDSGTVEFGPGDGLLAYSDGISELQNEQGEEFGFQRLLDEAERCERSSAARMLFCMLGVAKDFAGGGHPEDDITILALLRAGKNGAV